MSDLYLQAFRARAATRGLPGLRLVEEPGLHGAVDTDGGDVRLLAMDDRALAPLAQLLRTARRGSIDALEGAAGVVAHLSGDARCQAVALTAMAALDATAIARSVYARLGFEAVADTTRFVLTGAGS